MSLSFLSGHPRSAGNAVYLPADETSLLACEQDIDWRELDGLARAPESAGFAELPDLLLRLTATGLQNGPHRPWCHHIGADAPLDDLLGERLGVGDDAGLGGGIVQQDRRGIIGLDRRRRD